MTGRETLYTCHGKAIRKSFLRERSERELIMTLERAKKERAENILKVL